jgi:hypothetical protein
MLPWPHRVRRADHRRLARLERADQIGHQPVERPVAAADHVAGAHGGEQRAALRREVGTPIRRDRQLGRALAAAVGVVSAHRVGLAIGPDPFAILVAFVGGDADQRADAADLPRRFHDVYRAHHVGGVGLDRLLVGEADQGLRGEMEDHLRLHPRDRRVDGRIIADVALFVIDQIGDACRFEQARIGRRGEREAAHLGAHRVQP